MSEKTAENEGKINIGWALCRVTTGAVVMRCFKYLGMSRWSEAAMTRPERHLLKVREDWSNGDEFSNECAVRRLWSYKPGDRKPVCLQETAGLPRKA